MSNVKATKNWKTTGRSDRRSQIKTMFRFEGVTYDLTYPEMRALRKRAISEGKTHLADVLKGHLRDASGKWIETNGETRQTATVLNEHLQPVTCEVSVRFLRSGNRNAELGRTYGKPAASRKTGPRGPRAVMYDHPVYLSVSERNMLARKAS